MTHSTSSRPIRSQAGRALLVSAFLVAGVAVAAGVLLAKGSQAEEGATLTQHRYLAVTGHGSSARAWYDGASPSGVPVQDALDSFAEQGFRIVETTQSVDVRQEALDRWTILLSK